MSIKKKLGMALATTALGAMLIGGGTFALFSDTAINEGNTFTAGDVDISDVTGGAAFSFTQYFGNLAPGDQESATLTVHNYGSLDAWVRINEDNSVGTGDLFEGSHPLQVTLDSDEVLIPAGGQATFDVSYSFPLDAGNEYQGAQGELDIEVQAVQARNNTNGTNDGPINWQ